MNQFLSNLETVYRACNDRGLANLFQLLDDISNHEWRHVLCEGTSRKRCVVFR